ncbi:MAG TPA: HAMP domain-containing sensor histidine kinase [Syntrophales bacterium]|nr:HAMP domain-containing sensor histidine kinase [Syntrophales bacterium]HOM07763.1 HAMP domain-containing sensor histidine kinase [Syntrophales bacterium]
MKPLKWFLHPVFIFVVSLTALTGSLFLYIYWYLEVSSGLQETIRKYGLDSAQLFEVKTWVVIVVLSVLFGLIVAGVVIIFVYHEKTLRLYRLQRDFINNFTHELKTPLASLRLYLETFAGHEMDRQEQLRYVRYMLADVERLLGHVNRILDLARIETGTYEREVTLVDLLEVIEGFFAENQELLRGCDVAVHGPSGRRPRYHLNLPLFRMLLMNLLTNAIKHNTSGRPRIDVRLVPRRDRWDLRFEDNGVGLEKGERKKIFRKFYRAAGEENRAGGTGLGLYLVRQVAKIHGMGVAVESEGRGRGSAFILKMPKPAETA